MRVSGMCNQVQHLIAGRRALSWIQTDYIICEKVDIFNRDFVDLYHRH